jgi:hypothetical protein
VGSLLDERIDTPDIVSTAIDLAVRGYLTIQEEETTKLLFLTHRDYRFERLKPSDDALQGHERAFHDALFADGDSVLLSSLKNQFYTSIPSIRSSLVRQMLSKGLFPRDPARVRDFYRGVAAAAGVLPIGLAVVLLSSGRVRSFLPPEPAVFFVFSTVCLLFTILAVRLFVNAMPAKTAKGA